MLKRWLFALAILVNHGVIADRAKAQEAKDVTLTVSQADLAIIGEALGTIPYAKVAPLMAKLQAQVIKQNNPSTQATPEDKK